MITQYLAKLKANRLIKEQHKLYNTLVDNRNIKDPLSKICQLEDIENQKHKLRLANQAIRKAFNLTDPSTKLPQAGGILIYIDNIGNHVSIGYSVIVIQTKAPSEHTLAKASYISKLNRLRKENQRLSQLLNFPIKGDDVNMERLLNQAVYYDSFKLHVPNSERTYILKGLEAIATYLKKDITIIKPKGEIWKIT